MLDERIASGVADEFKEPVFTHVTPLGAELVEVDFSVEFAVLNVEVFM